VAVAVCSVAWAVRFRDDGPEYTVTVKAGNNVVDRLPEDEAIAAVAERVGFAPIVPDTFPIEHPWLYEASSVLPFEAPVKAPKAGLRFAARRQLGTPQTVWLTQTSVIDDQLEGVRQLDLGVEGALAYAPEGITRFIVSAGGMFVTAVVLAEYEVEDEHVLPMLRSIAEQLLGD
jgi:hypothetical protein